MTQKTKSLIYREMKVGRSFYLTTFVGYFVFLALIWLIRLSLSHGNLSHLKDSDDPFAYRMTDTILYFFSVYLTTVVAAVWAGASGVGISDIKTKWKTYSYALPISPKEAVNAKMIIKLFWTSLGLGLSLLNAWLSCLATDRKLDSTTVWLIIWIFNFVLISDLISTPVHLRSRTEKGAASATFFVFLMFIPALFATYLLNKEAMQRVKEFKDSVPEEEYNDSLEMIFTFLAYKEILSEVIEKVKVFALPAMLIILAAYYFLCCRAIQRREK